MSRAPIGCVLLVLLACATPRGGDPGRSPRSPSGAAYDARFPDPGSPLDVQTVSTSVRGPATVVELTYRGAPGRDPVRATLVRPTAGAAAHAGLLFVHWLGEPKTTNRTEFLDEAVELAGAGAVSLLPDALWSEPGWYAGRNMDADPAAFTAQVVDLRRALEVLAHQPGVDAGRLGIVGHDFGGMTGLLAGIADGRPRAHVLLALTPRFENWMFYVREKHPTDEAAYRKQLAPLDPLDALGVVEGAVLIQLAEQDYYVPPAQIELWRKAVGGKRALRTYATSHGMEAPTVRSDRLEWLRKALDLGEPARP